MHLSAHNAVQILDSSRAAVHTAVRARHQQRLDQAYRNAQKRAERGGRRLPPQGEYYNHWGHSYYSECFCE